LAQLVRYLALRQSVSVAGGGTGFDVAMPGLVIPSGLDQNEFAGPPTPSTATAADPTIAKRVRRAMTAPPHQHIRADLIRSPKVDEPLQD
jgi:hypothetical protein